ncbi:MAG: oligosaccharide flippase family protein [Pseudomonadota bacterium]
MSLQGSDPRDAVFEIPQTIAGLGAKTGRSASLILAFSIFKVCLTLLTTAILARYVAPTEHGLFALVIPVVLIASGLSEFGLSQAVVQRPKISHALVSTLLWVNLSLGLLLGLGVAALGGMAARFYDQPDLPVLFRMLAPYVVLVVLNTQLTAILRRQFRLGLIEAIGLAATVFASGAAVWAALLGWGAAALVVQLLLQPLASFLALAFVVGWRPSPPWHMSLSLARGALSFGGYLAAERLLGEVMRNLQLIIIGRHFSEVAAALFHRSQAIAQMPQRRLGAPLLGAVLPALSRLQDNGGAFEGMFFRIVSRSNFVLMPFGCLLIVLPDVVVLSLLGPLWADTIPLVQLLGTLPIFAMTLTCLATALIACGRARELFYFRVVSVVLLGLSLAISLRFGLYAMVASYLFTLVFLSGGILLSVVSRYTPLGFGGLLSFVSLEAVHALFPCVLGLCARYFVELRLFEEALLGLIAIGGALLLRIGFSPSLRGDIARVIKPARAVP